MTYLSPKIERLKAGVDSLWYYKIQLKYASQEIRKMRCLAFNLSESKALKFCS